MNKENLCFETRALGKLKILAFIGDTALLEKMYDTPEKYIVASGFNIEEKNWNFGSYFSNLKDAFERFTEKTNTYIKVNEVIKEKTRAEETGKEIDTADLEEEME